MSATFRYIGHTSDVGIELSADTLRELYTTAGRALFLLIAPGERTPTVRRSIETRGEDRETLLANFLNDLLFEFDTGGLLVRRIEFSELSATTLRAELFCEPHDPQVTEIETVVKAVTWHGLEVRENDDGWRGVVYLDL